ncbi:MAG: hypothetical protein GC154_01235 [bacterium]|nr:hypothetical protein [bacterium]
MSVMEVVLLILVVSLFLWLVHLKRQVHELIRDRDNRPEIPAITPNDLRALQKSLTELVSNIEYYTESQMQKISLQSEAIRTLSRRIAERVETAAIAAAPAPEPQSYATAAPEPMYTARITPLPPQHGVRHHSKDKIIELHQRGWSPEQIARELRLNKGEVQLIVNLF